MFFNLEIAVARFLAAKQIAEYLRSQKPLIMDVIELRYGSIARQIRAVYTDILHFRARVLAVYGQGMFMGNL